MELEQLVELIIGINMMGISRMKIASKIFGFKKDHYLNYHKIKMSLLIYLEPREDGQMAILIMEMELLISLMEQAKLVELIIGFKKDLYLNYNKIIMLLLIYLGPLVDGQMAILITEMVL